MNTKYILISYSPGSGGNFFSRCLNMIEGAHGWVDKNTGQVIMSLDEKIKILGYHNVANKKFAERNWIEFEEQLDHHHKIWKNGELPLDCYSIWTRHPTERDSRLATIIGPDDKYFKFYIDSGPHFEWSCMNAFYKNSILSVEWFLKGTELMQNHNVHKIKLDNFLKDWTEFYTEFKLVCEIIGHTLTFAETQAIKDLYYQWKTTILDYKDIENFKKYIGWNC